MSTLPMKIIVDGTPAGDSPPEGYFQPRFERFIPGQEVPPFDMTRGLIEFIMEKLRVETASIGCMLAADITIGDFRYRAICLLTEVRNNTYILISKAGSDFVPIGIMSVDTVFSFYCWGDATKKQPHIFEFCGVIHIAMGRPRYLASNWQQVSLTIGQIYRNSPDSIKHLLIIKCWPGRGSCLDEITNSLVHVNYYSESMSITILRGDYPDDHNWMLKKSLMRNEIPMLGIRNFEIKSCRVDLNGRIVIISQRHVVILAPDGALLAHSRMKAVMCGSKLYEIRGGVGRKPSAFHEVHLAPTGHYPIRASTGSPSPSPSPSPFV